MLHVYLYDYKSLSIWPHLCKFCMYSVLSLYFAVENLEGLEHEIKKKRDITRLEYFIQVSGAGMGHLDLHFS